MWTINFFLFFTVDNHYFSIEKLLENDDDKACPTLNTFTNGSCCLLVNDLAHSLACSILMCVMDLISKRQK